MPEIPPKNTNEETPEEKINRLEGEIRQMGKEADMSEEEIQAMIEKMKAEQEKNETEESEESETPEDTSEEEEEEETDDGTSETSHDARNRFHRSYVEHDRAEGIRNNMGLGPDPVEERRFADARADATTETLEDGMAQHGEEDVENFSPRKKAAWKKMGSIAIVGGLLIVSAYFLGKKYENNEKAKEKTEQANSDKNKIVNQNNANENNEQITGKNDSAQTKKENGEKKFVGGKKYEKKHKKSVHPKIDLDKPIKGSSIGFHDLNKEMGQNKNKEENVNQQKEKANGDQKEWVSPDVKNWNNYKETGKEQDKILQREQEMKQAQLDYMSQRDRNAYDSWRFGGHIQDFWRWITRRK